MSLTQSIIDRLQVSGGPFRIVEGAAGLANVKDQPNACPAAYVVIVEQISGDNTRATGPVLQLSEIDFAVVIITDNVSDEHQAAAAAEIETLTGFVRLRLLGVVPAGAQEPVEHVSGKLLKARAGTVWFEDRFTTTVYLEGVI